jgi:NADH-ubiquinone oxidoreductase chain 6
MLLTLKKLVMSLIYVFNVLMQANKQKKIIFLFIMNYSPFYVYRERYKVDILNIMFLNVLTETLTNGYKVEFLFVLSLTCIFLGISIIITKNPILSVLFLIALFFSVSLYLMLIGLYFMGLSYLLVYVGAISILFLFILMLINVRISELLTEGKNSIPLAIIAVLAFNFSVNRALPYSVSALDIISNNILSINRFIQSKIFSDETINVNKTVLNYTVD